MSYPYILSLRDFQKCATRYLLPRFRLPEGEGLVALINHIPRCESVRGAKVQLDRAILVFEQFNSATSC
jgi:hypothetical protein